MSIVDTWTARDWPILLIAVREADNGAQFEDVAAETGLTLKQVSDGMRALENAGYLEAAFAGAFSGFVLRVTERARRETGAWPSAETLARQIAEAFAAAADHESQPEKKTRLRAIADDIGGVGRGVTVDVIASVIRQVGHLP